MSTYRRRSVFRNSQTGSALFVSLIITTLVLGLIAAGLTINKTNNEWLRHTLTKVEAETLAKAAVSLRQKEMSESIANYIMSDADILGEHAHVVALDGRSVTVMSNVTRLPLPAGESEVIETGVNDMKAYVSYYEIDGQAQYGVSLTVGKNSSLLSVASAYTTKDENVVQTSCVVAIRRVPLYQYCAFFSDDLEILPSPTMLIKGPIHTNSNLYLGCQQTLTLDTDYVRAAGEVFVTRKEMTYDYNNRGTVSAKVTGTNMFKTFDVAMSPATRWMGNNLKPEFYSNYDYSYTKWADFAQDRWQGTVQTSASGVEPSDVPQLPTVAIGGYLNQQAGLVISFNNGGIRVMKQTQNTVGTVIQDITSSVPAGIITVSSLVDGREGKTVGVIDIDVLALQDKGLLPDNHLIYASRNDCSIQNPNGFRLKNGKFFDSPFFLTTPNPVYIQGDFNVGGDRSVVTTSLDHSKCKGNNGHGNNADDVDSSNSGNSKEGQDTNPLVDDENKCASGKCGALSVSTTTIITYTKQCGILMADAVNVLSNSWSNTKVLGQDAIASNTTINCAMIAGNVRTADNPDGQYSGGLENFPRMHENWSSKTLTINGAFSCLNESQYARGTWKGGKGFYYPPNRNWQFDSSLLGNTNSFLESIVPCAVEVVKICWTK